MRKRKYLLLILLILTAFIAGCNLFSFTNPTSSSTDYLSDGQRKYWDGDYSGAAEDFASAIEQNDQNGQAYRAPNKFMVQTRLPQTGLPKIYVHQFCGSCRPVISPPSRQRILHLSRKRKVPECNRSRRISAAVLPPKPCPLSFHASPGLR